MQVFEVLNDRLSVLATISAWALFFGTLIYVFVKFFSYVRHARFSKFRPKKVIFGVSNSPSFASKARRVAISNNYTETEKTVIGQLSAHVSKLGNKYKEAPKSEHKAIFTDAIDLLTKEFNQITGQHFERGSQKLIGDALYHVFSKEACIGKGGYERGSITTLVSERITVLEKSGHI